MIMPISPIWPAATAVNAEGSIEFHGRTAESLLDEFGSPLYLIDTDEVVARARHFVRAAAEAFNTSTTHVSFAGKAFLSKEVVRLVTEAGMFVDTCTMGEMKIALAAGVPGRRLVLHGNNKSDEEIALAIEQGFAKIVIDEPDEPERVAAIARKLGKRARVMLRVTVGVHAGGHEYISTAHEDQKFGVPLLAAGADAAVLDVLNDLKDVTPAATNARISATHSPENGAEKTEKSERELHYDVKYPYDLSHEEVSDTDKALAAAVFQSRPHRVDVRPPRGVGVGQLLHQLHHGAGDAQIVQVGARLAGVDKGDEPPQRVDVRLGQLPGPSAARKLRRDVHTVGHVL